MKGLILSGGKGTRLRPLTYSQAKQLVPVANKPVLFYGIEAMQEAGIRELGIVVGDTGDEIQAAVGDGSAWGMKVVYIEQEAPLGLAHAVKISEGFLQQDPFVMYLGDNILKSGIRSLVREFEMERPNALILLTEVPDPRMFGVVELKADRVVRLVEKPEHPPSNLALVGVYMFDHRIFAAVRAIQPSWRNELEITDAIQYLVDRGFQVRPHRVEGWWKDTGKIADILEANRLILESQEGRMAGDLDEESHVRGEVIIERGTVIKNCTLEGPVVIGEGCQLQDARVGPFVSIQKNCRISRTEIAHSIVMEGSEIRDVEGRITDSLIGRDAKIYRVPPETAAYRFVVGDKSEIGVG